MVSLELRAARSRNSSNTQPESFNCISDYIKLFGCNTHFSFSPPTHSYPLTISSISLPSSLSTPPICSWYLDPCPVRGLIKAGGSRALHGNSESGPVPAESGRPDLPLRLLPAERSTPPGTGTARGQGSKTTPFTKQMNQNIAQQKCTF